MIDIAYEEYQELKSRIESGEFIIREEFLEEKMYRNQYTIQHIQENQDIFFDMVQAYISKNKLPYVVCWGFDSVVVKANKSYLKK